MNDIVTVDARGLSCPQPAMMARKAITAQDGGTIHVLVDAGAPRDNVKRIAEMAGWNVEVEDLEDHEYRLVLSK